jgi:hypothetical protein
MKRCYANCYYTILHPYCTNKLFEKTTQHHFVIYMHVYLEYNYDKLYLQIILGQGEAKTKDQDIVLKPGFFQQTTVSLDTTSLSYVD